MMSNTDTVLVREGKNYKIIICDNVIGEDGNYGPSGYALVNRKYNIIERTSMSLPDMIFLMQQYEEFLEVQQEDKPTLTLVTDTSEDITPH